MTICFLLLKELEVTDQLETINKSTSSFIFEKNRIKLFPATRNFIFYVKITTARITDPSIHIPRHLHGTRFFDFTKKGKNRPTSWSSTKT